MKKNKVCVVGLDGATWKVLSPLLKKNKLPFLKSIISGSSYGTLLSPKPSLSAPSWASFMTGVNPGKHSIYDFMDLSEVNNNPRMNNSKDIKVPRIWDIFGKSKIKSLIINMPLTYPLKKVNGVMVSSFLTPKGADYVYPKKYQKLLDDIDYDIDILTDKKLGTLPLKTMSKDVRKTYLDKIIDISRKRLRAYKLLNETDDFSFSFLLFKETDIAQHLFWGEKELGDYYQELDKILKELHEYVINKNKDTSFVIMSDHGFHKASKWEFSVYAWMKKELKTSVKGKSSWKVLSSVNKKLKKYGLSPTSMTMVKNIRGEILKDSKVIFAKENGFLVSWQGLFNFGGIVDQSELDDIAKKLSNVSYRGKKVFKYVKRSNDVYTGSYVSKSPDLVWETNSDFAIDTNIFTKKIFKKRVNILKGEHGSDNKGVYIVKGKDVGNKKEKEMKMYDMNALLIKMMGISIPWYSDGVIPDFFYDRIDIKQKSLVENKISREINTLSR